MRLLGATDTAIPCTAADAETDRVTRTQVSGGVADEAPERERHERDEDDRRLGGGHGRNPSAPKRGKPM